MSHKRRAHRYEHFNKINYKSSKGPEALPNKSLETKIEQGTRIEIVELLEEVTTEIAQDSTTEREEEIATEMEEEPVTYLENEVTPETEEDTMTDSALLGLVQYPFNPIMDDLDEAIKKLMTKSDEWLTGSQASQGRARICNICEKKGPYSTVKDHIENAHISGISLPCHLCDKLFKSRKSLKSHKHKIHSKEEENTFSNRD